MTARDETGWEFDTVERTYANVGLNEAGAETVTAWEVARLSPRSTALRAEEVRQEMLHLPIRPREARMLTVKARMLYRFAPGSAPFGREGPSVPMAEASVTVPGNRAP